MIIVFAAYPIMAALGGQIWMVTLAGAILSLTLATTRISFVAAVLVCQNLFRSMCGRRPYPMGNIPRDLDEMRRNIKRLVLPDRRRERSYPRKVKLKMSNYDRKRPSTTPLN